MHIGTYVQKRPHIISRLKHSFISFVAVARAAIFGVLSHLEEWEHSEIILERDITGSGGKGEGHKVIQDNKHVIIESIRQPIRIA